MISFRVTASLLILLTSTVHAAVPSWVQNPPSRDGYVSGVGAADLSLGHASASEAAKLAARNEVASILKLEVGSELSLNNVSDEQGSRSDFRNNIRIRVPDIALSDIRIVESVEVAEHNTLYTLAELDLNAAAGRVASEIQQLLAEQNKDDTPSNSLAAQLRTHYRALNTQLNYRTLLQQYRLLRGSRSFDDDELNTRAARAEQFFDQLFIHINAEDDESKKLAQYIAAKLADAGLHTSEDRTKAALALTLNSQRRTMERNSAHFCSINSSAQLEAEHQSFSAAKKSAKAVSGDVEIACQKAAEKLGMLITSSILDNFWLALNSPLTNRN